MAEPYLFQKSNGYWYLFWYRDNKRDEYSLNTKEEKLARIRFDQLRSEIEGST